MRGDPRTAELLRPASPKEALALLARRPRALPLAGGTDLMVAWNMGLLNGRDFLDLSRLKAWGRVEPLPGGLRLGALVTHARLAADPAVRRTWPLLAAACRTVGAAQIQNRGTLGGNIANASPAGDTFPPLAVYEARVRAASAAGSRDLPFLEIFAGVKKTRLEPGELIESIELPAPARAPSAALFRKVGTRAAQAISKVVAAGLLWLDKDGTVRELRFALGSMAPTVRRLKEAEAWTRGRPLSQETIAGAVERLAADVSPVDDMRSSRDYRLGVARELLRGFLSGASKRGKR